MDKLVLVHFSDIHIGSTLLGTVRYKPLEARNGHSILLCQHLQNSFSRGRRDSVPNDFELGNDERLHFVLSGDLTRVGSRNDFHLAYQWLHRQWTLPGPTQPPRHVGLTLPADDLHTVPGNHDQWDGHSPSLQQGISPPAYNPHLAPTWFKATPWHVAIPSPKKAFVLDLFGVDSNSGLAGEGGNFFAEGAISDAQFKVLGAMLKNSRKAETADGIPRLRAIVCHHSFHQVGATACLRTPSIDRLTQLAHAYDVAAILTGHMHKVAHDRYPTNAHQVFWELRAASAVQNGEQKGLHGFSAHELAIEAGRPTWKAHQYELAANKRRFSRVTVHHDIR